ncbi:molybdopterin molybdenumtransferase [bacterium BMS3Abin07]|nr:molybdopterin molybdenumtransferase [bacterium BMS3Abin07]
MKVYLDNTPLHEALQVWFDRIRKLLAVESPSEPVVVEESLHRITAGAVTAEMSSPFYHASAMDGYAVRFSDTFGANETNPMLLDVPDKAVYVDTGDPMPDGFNAVIRIEDINPVERDNMKYIEIISPVTPWHNVRVIGEDIVVTELILPENSLVRPIDVAAMLAGGIRNVEVKKRPVVSIIPTGDEIVEYKKDLKKGDIIDTNSWMLSGYLLEDGASPIRHAIVPDNKKAIGKVVEESAASSDIVLVIAGSSAGRGDYTADVIEDIGEVLIHGVNIRPGKPVVLGIVRDKPVIGIPGYPVSAYLAYRLFVTPLIEEFYGKGRREPEKIEARLSRQVSSSFGVEEFVRVKLGSVSGNIIATPVSRGAGVIMSLVRADGMMRIPAMSEGFGAGAGVKIELVRGRKEIENTIVCIGSHDNSLDMIANFLKKRYPAFSLSSAHVGSMGGIMAIKNNEAHIAGTHLLDEDSGTYNIPYVRKFLKGKKLKIINLLYREQGLLVKKGNPQNINGIQDLARDDVTFVNRQAGSGTRLLTDKCLRDFDISPQSVRGYDKTEFTHMAVASAVKSDIADAGIGIYAASVALDLDFIPVAKEEYDIIIPEEYIDDVRIKAFLTIIEEDQDFRSAVMKLGGYDLSGMGSIVYEQ